MTPNFSNFPVRVCAKGVLIGKENEEAPTQVFLSQEYTGKPDPFSKGNPDFVVNEGEAFLSRFDELYMEAASTTDEELRSHATDVAEVFCKIRGL